MAVNAKNCVTVANGNVTFNLPVAPFINNDPKLWFALLEARLSIADITNDDKKYAFVLSSLETQQAKIVRDIVISPPDSDKYLTLKNEIIKRLGPKEPKQPNLYKLLVPSPPYIPDDPALWFMKMELHFSVAGVNGDEDKFADAVIALPPKESNEVREIIINPPDVDKYLTLKNEVINKFDPKTRSANLYKLPLAPFILQDPDLWFAMLELRFTAAGIIDDDAKFEYVVIALPSQQSIKVRDIIINPPTADKYLTLKKEMMRLGSSQEMRVVLNKNSPPKNA